MWIIIPEEGRFGRPICSNNKFSTRLSGSSSSLSVLFHCQTEKVQMVVWMLQRRLLIQVCNTYLLQQVFMSTRTSLNAYRLKNSCILARVNYPHFYCLFAFHKSKKIYLYLQSRDQGISRWFRGTNRNNGVRYSFHLYQPQKNCICCVWRNSNLSSAKFVLLPHSLLKRKQVGLLIPLKDFVNLIELFLFIFRMDLSMFCLECKTIWKDSGRGAG